MQCAKAYTADDVIILNGDDEDFELMKSNMETRRLAAKLLKKGKKKSKTDTTTDEPAAKTSKTASDKMGKQKAATSNGTDQTKGGKRKTTESVQDDPTASETYKSLFTSCDEAKKQGTQHSGWVSFNPQYFR